MKAGRLQAGGEMSQRNYTVRRGLLFVLGLDTLLLFCLLLMALLLGGAKTEKLVLALFFLPTFLLFLECAFRRIAVIDEGLAIRKFGRTRAFSWEEITRVGCLTVHRKVYLLLTTVKGLFIVSNAYGEFSMLVEKIVARVDPQRVEEDVRPQAVGTRAGIAPLVPAGVAAVIMIAMILVKLLPLIG